MESLAAILITGESVKLTPEQGDLVRFPAGAERGDRKPRYKRHAPSFDDQSPPNAEHTFDGCGDYLADKT